MTAAIATIYRYPVKSMGGHELDHAQLTATGIPGDRCWAVRDEERGGIKGGKRFASLMGMQAELTSDPTAEQPSPQARITLPDGQTFTSTDVDVNTKLSAAIGAPVSLWPIVSKADLDHYRRAPPDPDTDMEASMREVFARTADEPLPDLSVFPPELMTYESPPGTYFDAFSLLILSSASMTALTQAAQASDAIIDVRRFRPNILLDVDATGFAENAWAGKTATLGNARLRFEVACPRCVMTTHGFADIPKQPQVMRHLVQANEGNLGVYASVIEPGSIKVGDHLQLDG